jgi:2-methylisocitrate lyase-like PEP mutase family enzyme
MQAIAAAVDRPLVANFSEHGKTPLLSRGEVQQLGYAIALYPTTTLFAAARSAREIAAVLAADGTSRETLGTLMEFGELNELLGLSRWQEEERGAL